MRAWILILALLIPGLANATEQTAEDVVRATSAELLTVIEEGRTYVDEDPERFYRAVHDVLDKTLAFEAFARNVMGPPWKKATDEQRGRFVEAFKWGLLRTYAAALTQFYDGEVVVLDPTKPPRRPDRRNVVMEIRTSSGDVYPVTYTMALNKSGEWKIRNMNVGGINLGLTYRSQFKSTMKDPQYGGDLDRVIDAWATVLEESADEVEEEAADAA